MSNSFSGWGDPAQQTTTEPQSYDPLVTTASSWEAAEPATSSLSLSSSSSNSAVDPRGRLLHRVMLEGSAELPRSPKVRMRKPLPPVPQQQPAQLHQPTGGDNEADSSVVELHSPLLERFKPPAPTSPLPETGWRMRGVLSTDDTSGDSAAAAAASDAGLQQPKQQQLSEADWALVSEVERRRRELDDLLRSINGADDEQATVPPPEEIVRAEPDGDDDDDESLELRRRWVADHEKAWADERSAQRLERKAGGRLADQLGDDIREDNEERGQAGEDENEEEANEQPLVAQRRVEPQVVVEYDEDDREHAEAQDDGEETATEKTEEEELKDEIEQSMRNDKEKIREQMENLKRLQASAPKKTGSGWMATRRRSMMFSLNPKKSEPMLNDKDVQGELNRLMGFLKNMKVETLANSQSRKVIAMSGGLNIPQAYDFMERHGISSAPVYDEEGRTVGTIDSSDLMAFILISERPSFLQEVLRSNYDKDPFTKPVSAMIGASGRNQFTMVRAMDTVYSLMQVFSLGRPAACVLDHEDMISWVVSQSSLVTFIDEYLNSSGVHLGRAQAVDLNVIVSKIPFVRETAKAGEAFVSLCIHQAQAAAVIDEKRHFITEISSRCFRGLTRYSSAEFYYPIGRYMSEVHKVSAKGWDEPVTCRASITLRELLSLIVNRKAHRVWVVEGRKNKVVGLITLTSIIRSLLGVGILYDQKPPIQGKLGPAYFDITNPDQWPHLRNK